MRWERLCVKKEEGGMGFKDLRGFNMAMIFKSKYFPHGDFLSATPGGSPSFAWKGICDTQENTNQNEGLEELTVCDPWMPGTKEWDGGLLEELFEPEDVEAILSIPTTHADGEDEILWHYGKFGEYSVKSAYKLYMETMAFRGALRSEGEWNAIWRLQLPPKVKHFLWRLARGVLPLRRNLWHRRIHVPGECGLCGQGTEDVFHEFKQCDEAKDCWREAGLSTEISNSVEGSNFKDWLLMICSEWRKETVGVWDVVMWSLWWERNQRVWNGESRPARIIVEAGINAKLEWEVARGVVDQNQGRREVRSRECGEWHVPPVGKLKCNIDASFKRDEHKWGCGMAIRDHNGNLVVFRTFWQMGDPSVQEGEGTVLLKTLEWMVERGYEEMIIEIDSAVVAAAVMSHSADSTEFGRIIALCSRFFVSYPQLQVRSVRRNRNRVADVLAHRSFSLVSPCVGHASSSWLKGALVERCTDLNRQ
ncbi:Putative ribonuclease H protein At1g65750 [Linum perenne]